MVGFGMLPVSAAIDVIFATRFGWLAIPIMFGTIAWLALTANDEVSKVGDQNRAARDLWFSECKEPIHVCAAAWDDGWTLRELYVERVRPVQP